MCVCVSREETSGEKATKAGGYILDSHVCRDESLGAAFSHIFAMNVSLRVIKTGDQERMGGGDENIGPWKDEEGRERKSRT